MDKYENLDNFRKRTHTIEVTLQSGKYKGTLSMSIGGNCFGIDILDVVDGDTIYNIEDFTCIDCNVSLIGEDDDGNEWFSYTLKDKDGNTCEGEDECENFGRLIVGVNIVNCTIDDN